MTFLLRSFVHLASLELIRMHILLNVNAMKAEPTSTHKQDSLKKIHVMRREGESNLQVAAHSDAKRILVVTAMFGSRDDLSGHANVQAMLGGFQDLESLPKLPTGVDGVIYSDSGNIKVDPGASWQIVRTPYHTLGSGPLPEATLKASRGYKHSWANVSGTGREHVMAARFYKLNAYALPETEGYQVLVWIDSHWFAGLSKHCNDPSPPRELLLTHLAGSDLMMGKHPQRTRVKDEVGPAGLECAMTQKYHGCKEDAEEAWEHEKANGFKDSVGLFWSGFFAYQRDSAIVQDFLRQWWVEIQSFSFRDQLSFSYVLEKLGSRLNLKVLEFNDAMDLDKAMSHWRCLH